MGVLTPRLPAANRMVSRRELLKGAMALVATGISANVRGASPSMRERRIPSTGESIAAVGMGTWQTFNVGPSAANRAPLRDVLRLFVERGGQVVDSSPMYGRSEDVLGHLAKPSAAPSLFFATKVWTEGREAGIAQMERSFARLGVKTMDLMQIHNLLDWRVHLPTLRRWKDEGRIRYLGITHYNESAYPALESLLRAERLDFLQVNLSIGSRTAEERLLPLAADRGVAVLVNRPFEEGALFRRVSGRALPAWTTEFDCVSWGQFFLKYILAAPQVTCVIPATANPKHLVDNMAAGYGRLPDAAMRQRMVEHFESL